DVNALAVGEGRFGAGRSFREIIYVAVGTGVGGAIVRGGEIWRGVHFNAGEVAYLVADWDAQGRPVIVEDRASGLAMERRYQALAQSAERVPLRQIAERADTGDNLARRVIVEGARVLGLVLNPLVGILDPEMLIVGGGVPNIGPLWWDAFESALRDSPMPSVQAVHVAPAALSTNAGLIGAAALALNALDAQSMK
ncbi:MAG: ROK family protein, partial [Anaerolineae bacterium]|nr:ROK family protein [Anaerolineae bacterium]